MNGFWDWFRAIVCFILTGILFDVVFDIHPVEAMSLVFNIAVISAWVTRMHEPRKKSDAT